MDTSTRIDNYQRANGGPYLTKRQFRRVTKKGLAAGLPSVGTECGWRVLADRPRRWIIR
jgi:hypothetical protein